MLSHFNLENFVIEIIVLILSITLHEFGHAYSADRLGDDTPRRQGRVTLWPDKHFDPVGFIMILVTSATGYGLGWGKPVQVNLNRFRNVARADVIVTICGPLMNLALALVFGLILRFMINPNHAASFGDVSFKFVSYFVTINLSLMLFNLLPIYPLDGSHILRRALGPSYGEPYYAFMMQWGPMILLLMIISGSEAFTAILGPAMQTLLHVIVGV